MLRVTTTTTTTAKATATKTIDKMKGRQTLRTMARMNTSSPRRLASAHRTIEKEQKARSSSVFIGKTKSTSTATNHRDPLPVDRRGEFMFTDPEVTERPADRFEEDDLMHL